MKAAPNTVVKLAYELRTEPNGQVMDAADKDRPFSFLFGHGKKENSNHSKVFCKINY